MINYILIFICIIFSAFFSSSEITYASANELRLKHRAEDEKPSLSDKLAYKIQQKYNDALAAILIGNNLVNIASSSLATVVVVELLGEGFAWVATIVITVIVLIFGETVPKIIGKTISDILARLFAVPLYVIMTILKPAVIVVHGLMHVISKLWKNTEDDEPTVTEDELETIIDTVEDEGVIDEDKCDLIQNAFDFEDVQAYEVITPRVDMLAIDIDEPREDILKKIFASNYSRLPVYRDTVDNIIGIIHVNVILRVLADGKDFDIASQMYKPVFVYKTTPLDDVLSTMQKNKVHIVVVTDEYGGVMGILTMEDVLEQLVGDIWDESDVIEPEILKMSDGTFEVDADMRIEDVFDEIDFDDREFDDDNATIGGFVVELLERYARKNDVTQYENLKFTVLKVKKHRVMRLKIEVLPKEESEED